MIEELKEIDYKNIFKYFTEISKIPRCSGDEERISDYLVDFAILNNLDYIRDKANNVIITKEASQGYESEEGFILQAHMDMVCEKVSKTSHDFSNDPIELIYCEEFLCANKTTLGADNGIGLAYILAILSDKSINHPRIEAIITTDEEVGMNGAKALDLSNIKGKYMINLDSEEEGHMLVSCAGGLTGTGIIPINRINEYGKKIKIKICGLKGGHSGVEIHKNRSNATKLLARVLFALKESIDFTLINMFGGFKDNVIPREAEAELFISTTCEDDYRTKKLDERYNHLKKQLAFIMDEIKFELLSTEGDLRYELKDLGDDNFHVLDKKSFDKVLYHLINIPYGIETMSGEIKDLVESSINLGIFSINDNEATFCSSIRSSSSSYKTFLSKRLEYLTNFLDGKYFVRNEYPAWEYNPKSKLREHAKKVYFNEYKRDIKLDAIHAGLECGLISMKRPDFDIISIGPDMYHVHTVDERVNVSSAIRVYKFLEKIVEEKIN